jgi:hypothetical protein
VVRWASETDVPDTVSGFRALSREAALRLFVTTDFSYTVENLIQAGKKRLTVTTIPIVTNDVQRPSRLHRGNWNFIKQQSAIIARTYATYEPLKTFTYLAVPFFLAGIVGLGRAIYVYIGRNIWGLEASNDQALIGGGVALIVGFIIFMFGIVADRIGSNRRMDEELLYRIRSQEAATESWRRQISARLDRIERTFAEDEFYGESSVSEQGKTRER